MGDILLTKVVDYLLVQTIMELLHNYHVEGLTWHISV